MTKTEAASGILLNPVFLLFVVLLAGLPLVSAGMSPINLLPFIIIGIGLGLTVLTVGYASQALTKAQEAMLRIHTIAETPELELTSPNTDPVNNDISTAGTVRFDGVTFGYDPEHPVLTNVSFELRPGTITALVGPSGSGKSTLAKLLPRFLDIDAGSITIGGRNIREIPATELYRLVGFVYQDVRLLRDTVRANIALARPDATPEDIERVARAANIHDRIMELPRGYDSVVGEDGRLSGGESQRVSIARALLADAPVLVLDEATAFADPESEAAIQDALAELVADRTVLVIAHRLHTIVDVDQLIVLHEGRITQTGSHDTLVSAEGLYQTLWRANETALQHLAPDTIEPTAGKVAR